MKELLGPLGSWFYALLTSKVMILAVGGAVGTNLRYWVASRLGQFRAFPLGTFVINVSGSFILGAVWFLIARRLPPRYLDWYLLLGTGFCGGYTTFSTFELETFQLVRDGSLWLAMVNILGSVIVGFAAVAVAVALAGLILPRS